MKKDDIKKEVRKSYAKVAKQGSSCRGQEASTCCGPNSAETVSKGIGYTEKDMKSVPQGANLGLGCGNPVAIASLKPGETVLDLGAGAGFDCFLAARKVGEKGKVIGIDMTPAMIDKARDNAERENYQNVEFRLGEIENLPAADNSVDVVISNCVINLSTDKEKVLRETYRVLRPGGRISISDLALKKELPDEIRKSISAYVGCIGGAVLLENYKKFVKNAGFKDIKFSVNTGCGHDSEEIKDAAKNALPEDADIKKLADYVVSVYVEAKK